MVRNHEWWRPSLIQVMTSLPHKQFLITSYTLNGMHDDVLNILCLRTTLPSITSICASNKKSHVQDYWVTISHAQPKNKKIEL